jgi:hypothetical protein
MIALDTTALSLLFVPNALANTKTGKPIKHAQARMEHLIEKVSQEDDVILIPTPCLAEIFVKLDPLKIDGLLKRLKSSPWFRVESFDAAAAVELGLRTSKAISLGDKREGLQADHTKIKFDRQIVSIALVNGATEIISDDSDIAAIGGRWGISVKSVSQLALPPSHIPPPLLAKLEEEDDETKTEPASAEVLGGGDGHPQGEAGAKAAEAGTAQQATGTADGEKKEVKS